MAALGTGGEVKNAASSELGSVRCQARKSTSPPVPEVDMNLELSNLQRYFAISHACYSTSLHLVLEK